MSSLHIPKGKRVLWVWCNKTFGENLCIILLYIWESKRIWGQKGNNVQHRLTTHNGSQINTRCHRKMISIWQKQEKWGYTQAKYSNSEAVCLLKWNQFKSASRLIQIMQMQVITMTDSQWANQCVYYRCIFRVTKIKELNSGQPSNHSVKHSHTECCLLNIVLHKPLQIAACDRNCCCQIFQLKCLFYLQFIIYLFGDFFFFIEWISLFLLYE